MNATYERYIDASAVFKQANIKVKGWTFPNNITTHSLLWDPHLRKCVSCRCTPGYQAETGLWPMFGLFKKA